MSRRDAQELVRNGIEHFLKVHPRLLQQNIEPSPAQKAALIKMLPSFVPFQGHAYAGLHVILDWDHQLPSQWLALRLYFSYHHDRIANIERQICNIDKAIAADNLYPEFNVPDYGEVSNVDEVYTASLPPTMDQIHELLFASSWRKQVPVALRSAAITAVYAHPSFKRALEQRSNDQLGPPVVIGWAPPCLAKTTHWSIEVWLLLEFDGRVGKAHIFMVDGHRHQVSHHYVDSVYVS